MRKSEPVLGQAVHSRAHNLRKVLQWLESTGAREVTSARIAALVHARSFDGKGRSVAGRLVERGVLQRLAPGRYAVIRPGEAPRAPLDKGQLLDHWFGDRYALAFTTAMALHGFGTIEDGSRLQLLLGRPFMRAPDGLGLAVETRLHLGSLAGADRLRHPALGEVRARSLVETAADAVVHVSRCGGLARVAAFVRFAVARQHPGALVDAALRLQRGAMCRLGYLLEQAGVEAASLDPMKRMAPGKHVSLDPDGPQEGPLEPTWRLRLNARVEPGHG